MLGAHLVKSWSRTQDSVTLSSAEAELVALGKLVMESLGIRSICREWGSQRKDEPALCTLMPQLQYASRKG